MPVQKAAAVAAAFSVSEREFIMMMKKIIRITGLFCGFLLLAGSIPAGAEQLSVRTLQDSLLQRSEPVSPAYDLNHDNQVNIYDWILLKRRGLPSEEDVLEPKNTVHSGDATFYGGGYEGGCAMLDPISKDDYWITAMNLEDYNTAQLAGAYLEVTGESGTIHVLVTDLLPEGKKGDLDLYTEAFPLIAPVEKGRVPVTWKIIPTVPPMLLFLISIKKAVRNSGAVCRSEITDTRLRNSNILILTAILLNFPEEIIIISRA